MPLYNPSSGGSFTPAQYSGYFDLATNSTNWQVTSTTYSDFNVATVASLATRSNTVLSATGGGSNVLPEIDLSGLVNGGRYAVSVSFPMFGSVSDAQGIQLTDGTNVLGEVSGSSLGGEIPNPTLVGCLVATGTTATLTLQGRTNNGQIKISFIGANGGNTVEWNIHRIA